MLLRETEIHYSIWLYSKDKMNVLFVFILSVALHILLAVLLHFITPEKMNTFLQDSRTKTAQQPIRIDLKNNLTSQTKKDRKNKKARALHVPKNQSGSVLSDQNENSDSKVLVPKYLASPDIKAGKNPFVTDLSPTKDKKEKPASLPRSFDFSNDSAMQSFLPNANQNYIDNLRRQAAQPAPIQADTGDIPLVAENTAPRNGGLVKERYATKDLSLFQFSQDLHEKFGAVWNSQERWVPPSSPLRPGDIVYYKIYVKGDGSLEKIENLTQKNLQKKDFSDLDKIINEVVAKVFPITMPPRFSRSVITDIVAIQVVGANRSIQHSF